MKSVGLQPMPPPLPLANPRPQEKVITRKLSSVALKKSIEKSNKIEDHL